MTTFLWSDTHFGHANVIRYSGRPFADLEAMNEQLISAYRSVVGRHDRVFHLGDFGFGPEGLLRPIFEALPGEKHLIIGNHDEKNKAVLKLPWASTQQMARIKDNGRKIFACHYPMVSWPYMHHGHVHAHGHCHGNLTRRHPRSMDVGVDALWDGSVPFGMPATFDAIYDVLDAEPFKSYDHHTRD